MKVREVGIPGAYIVTPQTHADERGIFFELFKTTSVEKIVGARFDAAQVNCSISQAGALRGIHFSDVPPGQAKFVACITGAVFDVIVDVRRGSPTFGRWESVVLDDVSRQCVYLAEGLGHAFLSLRQNTAVTYLCSTEYAPGREHTIHPYDARLAVKWPDEFEHRLSARDLSAPSFTEAEQKGILPTYESGEERLF
jgi:dTDP-4-dehydrorhamnose 3,5-epimerase